MSIPLHMLAASTGTSPNMKLRCFVSTGTVQLFVVPGVPNTEGGLAYQPRHRYAS